MSKRKNGLAVLALLLSLVGGGLGFYSVFFMPNIILQQASENSVISEMWFDERETAYAAGYSFYDIPDLGLTITVNPGEKVFILFSGEIQILASGWGEAELRFEIDNNEIDSSHKQFTGDSSSDKYGSMTLQYVAESLTTGTHIIHVQAKIAFLSTAYIRNMHLLAYTFK